MSARRKRVVKILSLTYALMSLSDIIVYIYIYIYSQIPPFFFLLTRITLLRILLMSVITVKPVPKARDGISKDTLFLSNTGVSSVVVVVVIALRFCAHK